jgi:hypothetical protein
MVITIPNHFDGDSVAVASRQVNSEFLRTRTYIQLVMIALKNDQFMSIENIDYDCCARFSGRDLKRRRCVRTVFIGRLIWPGRGIERQASPLARA